MFLYRARPKCLNKSYTTRSLFLKCSTKIDNCQCSSIPFSQPYDNLQLRNRDKRFGKRNAKKKKKKVRISICGHLKFTSTTIELNANSLSTPFGLGRTFFYAKCPYTLDRLYRVTKKIIAVRIAFEGALIAAKHDALRTNLLGHGSVGAIGDLIRLYFVLIHKYISRERERAGTIKRLIAVQFVINKSGERPRCGVEPRRVGETGMRDFSGHRAPLAHYLQRPKERRVWEMTWPSSVPRWEKHNFSVRSSLLFAYVFSCFLFFSFIF